MHAVSLVKHYQQEEEDVVKMLSTRGRRCCEDVFSLYISHNSSLVKHYQQEEEDVVKMLFPCIIHIIPANSGKAKLFETYINIF